MDHIFIGIRKFFRLFFYFNFWGRFIIYPFFWMKKSCQFSVSCLNFSKNVFRGYLWDFENIWKWSMRLFRRIWRKWNMWIIGRISFCIGGVLISISIIKLFFLNFFLEGKKHCFRLRRLIISTNMFVKDQVLQFHEISC